VSKSGKKKAKDASDKKREEAGNKHGPRRYKGI
jgi:hypothetical protein